MQGNGARNPDAGFLPARELMREALEEIDREPHQVGQFVNPCVEPAAVMQVAQTPQWLGDRGKGRKARIEAVSRVLKDQLQARPFRSTRKAVRRHGSNVTSGKMDGPSRRVEKAGDHPYQGGFAAARFTDQTNALAWRDGKRDAIDRTQQPLGRFRASEGTPEEEETPQRAWGAEGEVFVQSRDFEERYHSGLQHATTCSGATSRRCSGVASHCVV